VEAKDDSVRAIMRETIEEFVKKEQSKTEPAYKVELVEERKRREQLERRLNELVEENKRSRQQAEESDRAATIRAELQRMGVAKVDVAFKAIKDDIYRAEDGRLLAKGEEGDVSVKEYVSHFLNENPEFLPARIAGGSGAVSAHKPPAASSGAADLDKIRPGMSAEETERIRQEIVRIASQTLRGA
jgi:GTPase SAR1 family protein